MGSATCILHMTYVYPMHDVCVCVCVERAPGRAGPAKSNSLAADTDIVTEKHSPHNTKPPQHNAGTAPNCKDPTIPLHRNAPTLRDDHKTVTKIKKPNTEATRV